MGSNQELHDAIINFYTPFKDFHLVSQDYEITNEVLEVWTLGRIKIPKFISKNEMIDWIIAVDFIVKSQSIVISGPANPFYYSLGDGTYYTQELSIEDVNGVVYHIPERNYYNKNSMPLELLDTNTLYNFITQSVDVYLDVDTYGPCFTNEKVNGKFLLKDVNICGIVEFLLNKEKAIYLPPKAQLNFGINTDNYAWEDDFDACNIYWKFKDSEKPSQVLIIETELGNHKKKLLMEYFDSWRMWHEKFFKNNKLYFVLFQTDEMGTMDIMDFFKPLIDTFSKSNYAIHAYSYSTEEYINLKLLLREGKINTLSEG